MLALLEDRAKLWRVEVEALKLALHIEKVRAYLWLLYFGLWFKHFSRRRAGEITNHSILPTNLRNLINRLILNRIALCRLGRFLHVQFLLWPYCSLKRMTFYWWNFILLITIFIVETMSFLFPCSTPWVVSRLWNRTRHWLLKGPPFIWIPNGLWLIDNLFLFQLHHGLFNHIIGEKVWLELIFDQIDTEGWNIDLFIFQELLLIQLSKVTNK